ncbi:Uncharacterized protein FWK35_00012935, partial [Aphis craccivora]
FIPTVFHDFYKNLSNDKSQIDQICLDEEQNEED